MNVNTSKLSSSLKTNRPPANAAGDKVKDLLDNLDEAERKALQEELFSKSSEQSEPLIDRKTMVATGIAATSSAIGGAALGALLGTGAEPLVAIGALGVLGGGVLGMALGGSLGSELPAMLIPDDNQLARNLSPFGMVAGGAIGGTVAVGGLGIALYTMASAGVGGGALIGAGVAALAGGGIGYAMAHSSNS